MVIAAGLVSLLTQGLNYGIDFKGGTSWEVKAPGVSVAEARDSVRPFGMGDAKIQIVGGDTVRVAVRHPGARGAGPRSATPWPSWPRSTPARSASTTSGPSWGKDVTKKARNALVVFFVLISAYISLRFEWKMAVAALAAVVHDILVTVGVYSISRFEVTPATVVAFLTILGYSLYDTIVVFDKVEENAKGLAATGRMTYSDTVNLSMNQVLMRSLNTSLVAILPILSILVIGAGVLGATTLKDFGLALLVGLLTGAYSSIFVAAPVLAILKEREPRYAGRPPAAGGQGRRLGPAHPGRGRGPGGRRAAAGAGQGQGLRRPAQAGAAAKAGGPSPAAAAKPAATTSPPAAPSRPPAKDGDVLVPARPTSAEAGAAAGGTRRARGRRRQRQPPVEPPRRPPAPQEGQDGARLAHGDATSPEGPHPRRPRLPQPGIVFKDITPLLGDAEAFRFMRRRPRRRTSPTGRVDKVVGIEARGFILAAPVAYRLGAGFVPVRKAGQAAVATPRRRSTPSSTAPTASRCTTTPSPPGEQVLVVDDVLATGGTAAATVRLVERLGATVVGLGFVIELAFLGGRTATKLCRCSPTTSTVRS